MGTGRPRRQKRKGSAQTRRPRGFFLLLALLFALTAAAIVLTAAELASGRPFAWLWTRKEAALKLDGRGITLPLPALSVLDDELTWNGHHIALTTECWQEHFISCAEIQNDA